MRNVVAELLEEHGPQGLSFLEDWSYMQHTVHMCLVENPYGLVLFNLRSHRKRGIRSKSPRF